MDNPLISWNDETFDRRLHLMRLVRGLVNLYLGDAKMKDLTDDELVVITRAGDLREIVEWAKGGYPVEWMFPPVAYDYEKAQVGLDRHEIETEPGEPERTVKVLDEMAVERKASEKEAAKQKKAKK